jgi:endogenous inhibitor of DNA gyrase (YacG/DUF329 family)
MAQSTCAVCGKAVRREGNAAFPFCSPRCRTIDLGAWLGEEYRVPVGEDETERDGVSEQAVRGSSEPPD